MHGIVGRRTFMNGWGHWSLWWGTSIRSAACCPQLVSYLGMLDSSKSLFVNSTVATPKYFKVNELRYQMFRSRRGEMESAQLPPCEDTLKQHTRRANYQAAIWRRSLVNSSETPNPSQRYGWTTSEDGSLVINGWQDRKLPKWFSVCCRANALRVVGRTTALASLLVWSAQLRANWKHALTWPVMMTSQRTISRTRQTVKTNESSEMPQVRKFIVFLPYVYMFSHP